MKLHAGSLYKNTLILKGENVVPHIIFFEDGKTEENLQWEIYCNDVDLQEINSEECIVTFQDIPYSFPYSVSNDPMKFLGFSR